MARILLALVVVVLVAPPPTLSAQSLRGSRASLARQNEAARRHDYSYLETVADVERFVRLGLLVRIEHAGELEVDETSFPFGRWFELSVIFINGS